MPPRNNGGDLEPRRALEGSEAPPSHEIEEQAGDERAALHAFRQALAMDPKVGVAKRAAVPAKRLGA